jgi:hypothetical protein
MLNPDFTNKILLIYLCDRPDEHNVLIKNAAFVDQGGRVFLVGEFAEDTTANDWAAGVQTAIAWDRVEQYLVFDSIEDYFARVSAGWENKTVQ